jgi:hypothetical protein
MECDPRRRKERALLRGKKLNHEGTAEIFMTVSGSNDFEINMLKQIQSGPVKRATVTERMNVGLGCLLVAIARSHTVASYRLPKGVRSIKDLKPAPAPPYQPAATQQRM